MTTYMANGCSPGYADDVLGGDLFCVVFSHMMPLVEPVIGVCQCLGIFHLICCL